MYSEYRLLQNQDFEQMSCWKFLLDVEDKIDRLVENFDISIVPMWEIIRIHYTLML